MREGRGMTKRDLAAAAGVSKKTVRNAERGEPVRSKTARKVARPSGSTRPSAWAARRVGRRVLPASAFFLRLPKFRHLWGHL